LTLLPHQIYVRKFIRLPSASATATNSRISAGHLLAVLMISRSIHYLQHNESKHYNIELVGNVSDDQNVKLKCDQI
jgi:hypothetical protein